MLLPALAARLRVEFELSRRAPAAALAAELLVQPADSVWLPPGTELAWTSGELEPAAAVRDWIEAIAMRSAWNEAALAILDGELEEAADLFAQIGSLPDAARARLRAAEKLLDEG